MTNGKQLRMNGLFEECGDGNKELCANRGRRNYICILIVIMGLNFKKHKVCYYRM